MALDVLLRELSSGLLVSLEIFFLTLAGALPLGMIVAFGRMSRVKPLQLLVKLYISIMRGTPLMLQLLVVYFGPYYIFGIRLTPSYRFIAVIIGFVLNYAAYFAEIYRSGIEAMPKGQYEAADVLGYSKIQTFFKIILPQVIKTILPSVTNEVITLVKDTSLAYTIGVAEMFTQAKIISAAQSAMTALIVAGVFYYFMNLIVAYIMGLFEKKLNYFK